MGVHENECDDPEGMSATGQSTEMPNGSVNRKDQEDAKDVQYIRKIAWYFQPLFPIYEAVKTSNAYTNYYLQVLENILTILLSLLESGDVLTKDKEPAPGQVDKEGFPITVDPILSSLFRIWFQAHTNLRQSIYYIEHLYEEIVPLIPGRDPPFTGMDMEKMTIRAMCCHATLHMICRLPYYATKFISRIFRRIKCCILHSNEEII